MALGVRAMIRMAVRGTSWSHFYDYASPALFDVIPARALLAQSRELLSNRSDAQRFRDVREDIGTLLRRRNIEVELTDGLQSHDETALVDLPESVRREVGQRILEIYFTQVFGSDDALLDLRRQKLARGAEGQLRWRPGALYVRWQPDFLEGIRGLYSGFYLPDETAFDAALGRLNMGDAADALRDLLGRDDPRSARFSVAAFHSSFHTLFVTYRERGLALHRNFLPLGVYLMCLYDALESLGVELDVKAAFDRAQGYAPEMRAP